MLDVFLVGLVIYAILAAVAFAYSALLPNPPRGTYRYDQPCPYCADGVLDIDGPKESPARCHLCGRSPEES